MKNLPRFAAFALIFSAFLIGFGCFMAINSCAKSVAVNNNEGLDNPELFEKFSRDSLYFVMLPANIPQQVKEYNGFLVSFNKENRTPNYVTWELLSEEVEGMEPRAKNFWQDFEIEGCPDQNAYKYTGYDRGHLCPAADQKWSAEAMYDCFVMANICPQHPDLNQKAWETLENKERQWAKRDGRLWIAAGPIYTEEDTKKIGPFEVRVPSAFFKAFLAIDVTEPRAIAFVYPNMLSPGNMQNYSLSIDELEEITGYDFFSALPDDLENKVEASYSFKEWNQSK